GEGRGAGGRPRAALYVRRLEGIDIAARAGDRLFGVFGVDLAFRHPLPRLVEDVVGAGDVRIAGRPEVERAARDPRLRVPAVRASLLPPLATNDRVAQVAGALEQARPVRRRIAHP